MNEILRDVGLTYDDVQLVPRYSEVSSRLDVNISTNLCGLELDAPFMSAAMDTVTELKMAQVMCMGGGIGIIHRFQSAQSRINMLSQMVGMHIGVSVGLDDSLEDCAEFAKHAVLLNVDIAHAHSKKVIDFVNRLQELKWSGNKHFYIMTGNVATAQGALDLIKAGSDIIKVGIGGGSICTTRLVTGFGVPNITAIMDVASAVESTGKGVGIVADGGIRYPGDIAKAIAAGADAVMLGSMLAGTDETPGEKVLSPVDGKFAKKYRGMASKDAQDEWRGMKSGTAAEGVTSYVPCKGSALDVLKTLSGGLRSSLTYCGASNLKEFYNNTIFTKVTPSGVAEASAHIFSR